MKTLLAQTLTTGHCQAWKIDPNSLTSFSNDQNIEIFSSRLILPVITTEVDNVGDTNEIESKLVSKLVLQSYDCLIKDRMHALPIYVQLLSIMRKLELNQTPQPYLWQIKILSTILKMYRHIDENEFLLSVVILNSIDIGYKKRIQTIMEMHKSTVLKGDLKQFHTFDQNVLNQLAIAMNYFELPQHGVEGIRNLFELIMRLNEKGLDGGQVAKIARYLLESS